MNAFILTVKGQKVLTEQCLLTMSATLGALTQPALMIVVDAARGQDAVSHNELTMWLEERMPIVYAQWPNCTLTQGWNFAINALVEIVPNDLMFSKVNVHLMQNDAIFLREGWLSSLETLLMQKNVGTVGTSGMKVHGYDFVTGVIQSFRLADGLAIVENGKVIDERFNHAFPDVDLSIRFSKAGYVNIRAEDIELGNNPSIKHLVSATMYAEHGMEKTFAMREAEEKIFLEKWGKND